MSCYKSLIRVWGGPGPTQRSIPRANLHSKKAATAARSRAQGLHLGFRHSFRFDSGLHVHLLHASCELVANTAVPSGQSSRRQDLGRVDSLQSGAVGAELSSSPACGGRKSLASPLPCSFFRFLIRLLIF